MKAVQKEFPLEESVDTTPRIRIPANLKEVLIQADIEAFKASIERRVRLEYHSASLRRRQSFHLAEGESARVRVESVSIRRAGGTWKVLAKGFHVKRGPVYRYGFITSMLELGELLVRWNEKDEWTKDKYANST